jgi:ABC-type sulfate transport system permease subunit
MSTSVTEAAPGRITKLLAILSLACFWVLPFSPLVAIGAVSMTKGTSGWSRNLAVTGAVLCTAYTIVMALITLGLYLQIGR